MGLDAYRRVDRGSTDAQAVHGYYVIDAYTVYRWLVAYEWFVVED